MKILNYLFLLLIFFNIGIGITQQNDPPNWSWANNMDGTAKSITTDSIGNSYVAGNYVSAVTFGATTLAGSGAYVVKYDSTGTVLWARQVANGGTIRDIAIDGLGNYYITGFFNATITVGGTSLTSAGLSDIFYAKFNAGGTLQWANKHGGIYDDEGNSIAVDRFGNCFIAAASGGYNGSGNGYYDEILNIKVNSSGVVQFATGRAGNWESTNYLGVQNKVNAIGVDNFGNSYVSGMWKPYTGSMQFFITKYDPSGNEVWFRNGSGYAIGNDMATDGAGNCYITGQFSSSVGFGAIGLSSSGAYDIFAVKYDASGQVAWAKSAGGVDYDYGDGITIDILGNAYVTGRFQQNANFSQFAISNLNSGVSDVFVAKYSSIGEVSWVKNAGDGGVDAGTRIALDRANNCYINGIYTTSISLDANVLNGGANNSFVAKIGSNVEDTLVIYTNELASHTYTAGTSAEVSFSVVGNFSSDNIFTVELSDAVGGFFYPAAIGTGLSSPITAVIPPLTVPGSSYRIRVVASHPAISGRDNGTNIAINNGSQQISPDWSWAENIGGTAKSIATDSVGNSYVTGSYSGSTIFGSTTLTGNGAYVAKYDATGLVQWARQIASGAVVPEDIAIDDLGNYYVTGSFSATSIVAGTSFTSAGSSDIFYVKFDGNGVAQWANKYGGVYEDEAYGIAVDRFDNCFISGGSGGYTGSSYYDNILTLKLNSAGVVEWTKTVAGNFETPNYLSLMNRVRGITTDAFGNSYVTGNWKPFSGSDQFFLLKYDPSGNQVWMRNVVGNIYGNDIVADNFGNTYTSGYFYYSASFGTTTLSTTGATDIFTVKYDAAGQVVWAKSAGGADYDYGDGIALDASGEIYVTGRFQHSAYFSGINISNFNSGVSDVFVAKYDNSGNALWVKQAGESGVDLGAKIGVSDSGTCFVTGTYTFDINFGDIALSGAKNNSYLASIGSAYETSIGNAILIAGTRICSGNVLKVEYPVKGIFNAANVFTAQLSDEFGSFSSPINVGEMPSSINNTIYAIIPDLNPGTAYRIRVVSSDIALTGGDNGIDLSINLSNCDSVVPVLEVFPLVAFEYFFDVDNGVGTYVPVSVTSADSISTTQSISVAGLTAGFHNLFIRFKDTRNVWSLYEGRVIYVQPVIVENNEAPLVSAEYFFDTDPGVGNGTDLASFAKADNIDLVRQVDVTGLSAGFHNLFIRTKDSLNVWSMYEGRVIYVQPTIIATDPAPIISGEYFFNTDPGIGNGTALAAFAKADSIDILRQISVSGLTNGYNNLFIRVKDSLGIWSLYEGRKFFICPDVLDMPLITGPASVCQNADITLSGSAVSNATSYLWTGPAGFTQSGQNLSRANANTSMSGTYTFYAIRSGGTKCDTSFTSITVTVNPIYSTNNPQVICENDSYAINGNTYTLSGTYNDTLSSVNGCDSVIVTQLTVIPTIHADNYQNLCGTATYTFNGNTYASNGTYVDTVQTVNGCDSIVTTYLTINPVYSVNNPQTICTGGSYVINGNTYTIAGNYTDILQSVSGCDSTVITQLSVVNSFTSTNTIAICDGESVVVGSSTYTISGTYTDVLSSIQGCDSIVTTNLTVNPTFTTTNPQTICEGGSYSINGNTYTLAGTYTDLFQAITGCDSSVITQLTVNPTYTVNNPQSICDGDSYTVGGSVYTTAGTYTDVLQSVNGCDSIVTTSLNVNPVYATNNPQTICFGGSYSINGNSYTVAGSYPDLFQSVNGCDSVVTTILSVNPVYTTNNPQTICFGESYVINGNTYTVSGTYPDLFQSIYGCDSTVTTQLTVRNDIQVNNPQTVCFGESYTINGNTYTVSGIYPEVFQSVNGCDSTVTTQLTVRPDIQVNNPQTVCFGESYTINGNTYTVSGTYPEVFQSVNGCDSTVTTQLTVRPNIQVNNPQSICQGGSYVINGNTYASAGNYLDTLQSVNGCDSIVTTILTVNNPALNTSLSISADGLTLTALENNATYQWLDCENNNIQISGEDNQSFTATSNGEYSVVLTALICNVSDTSLCFTIDNVGLDEAKSDFSLNIYPNPAHEQFIIQSDGFVLGEIIVFNADGKIVYSKICTEKSVQLDVLNWADGMYLLQVKSERGTMHQKIIKE